MREQYIPDLTERFPEGFDGVDRTDSYFYEPRRVHDDWDLFEMNDRMNAEDEIPFEI